MMRYDTRTMVRDRMRERLQEAESERLARASRADRHHGEDRHPLRTPGWTTVKRLIRAAEHA